MEPVTTIQGHVTVLDRADVDTDQIIPKQFLKRIERTGYGEFLFFDWVRSGEVSIEPGAVLVAGRTSGVARRGSMRFGRSSSSDSTP